MTSPEASISVLPVPRARVDGFARYLVTLVCAVSAGVHAALVPEHLHESTQLGLAFAVSTVALALAALTVRAPGHDHWAPAVSAVVLVSVAGAYLLSRTIGIPVLMSEPEAVDPLGVLTSSAEVMAAATALVLLTRRGL